MKKRSTIIFMGMMLLSIFFLGRSAQAEDDFRGWKADVPYQILQDESGNSYIEYARNSVEQKTWLRFSVPGEDINDAGGVSFTSSNPEVFNINEYNKDIELKPYQRFVGTYFQNILLKLEHAGETTITAKVGEKEYSLKLIIYSEGPANITSVQRVGYDQIRLNWDKVDQVTGYKVVRKKYYGGENWEAVAEIDDPDTLSVDLTVALNVTYCYSVYPKTKIGEKEYGKASVLGQDTLLNVGKTIKLTNQGRQKITSLNVSGEGVTLEWTPDPYVRYYNICVKNSNGGGWKVVHSVLQENVNTYTISCDAGNRYDILVRYVYSNDAVSSETRNIYIPKDTVKSKCRINISQWDFESQYAGNWSSSDDMYYYQKDQKFHVVSYSGSALTDYRLNDKGKIVSKKKVKLPDHDKWGAFHYSTDGNYYIVLGYDNSKMKAKKIVLRVFKYSPKWEKLGVSEIKASYNTPEVERPLASGNCRMESFNGVVFIYCSYVGWDGHQRNCAYRIFPKTMQYLGGVHRNVSHSFNQFVRYDNDVLYLSDHGDAWPRGINLAMYPVGTKKSQSDKNIVPFKIKGKSGDNFTGLTEGGMETTRSHVLIAGTSQPQKDTVDGVTGNKVGWLENVYLISCDKNTGESKFTWLTKYNPKKKNIYISEVRLVKISDEYSALLYVVNAKKEKVLNYIVVNENGDVVYTKKYKNMIFNADTQPIVHNGSIVWTASNGDHTYLYRIPVLVKE